MKTTAMKILLLFASLTLCFTLNAQFTVQDSFEIFGKVGDKDIGPYFTLTNSSDTVVNFYWKLVKEDDFPRDWEISICDQITCWVNGQEVSNCEALDESMNSFQPGEENSFFKVGVKSATDNGISSKGRHSATFYLTKECDNIEDESVLTQIHFTFEVTGSVSTFDIAEDSSHSIFPNPSQNLISVSNDEQIAGVTLYTITGHQLSSVAHNPGKQHDISTLERGMYLIELRDRQQKVLGVERMMKVD